MSDNSNHFLRQLLEYYRTPLAYPGFVDRHQPLPPQLSELLTALSGSGAELARMAEKMGVEAAEFRQAAMFYIKQLLFAPSADYYRLLGVDPDASLEKIKAHYRALIRLFHPDKNPDADAWDDDYAPRLNEAYNTLKKPQQRAGYDRRLREETVTDDWEGLKNAPVVRYAPPEAYVETPVDKVLGTSLWQHSPKLVVSVLLLTMLLLVLWFSGRSSQIVALKQKKQELPLQENVDKEQSLLAQERDALDAILSRSKTDEPPEVGSLAPSLNDNAVQDVHLINTTANQSVSMEDQPIAPEASAMPGLGIADNLISRTDMELIAESEQRNSVPATQEYSDAASISVIKKKTQQAKSLPDKPVLVPTIQKGVVKAPAGIPEQENRGLTERRLPELEMLLLQYLVAYRTGDDKRLAALASGSPSIPSHAASHDLRVEDTHWVFDADGRAKALLKVVMNEYRGTLTLTFVDTEKGAVLQSVDESLQMVEKPPSPLAFFKPAETKPVKRNVPVAPVKEEKVAASTVSLEPRAEYSDQIQVVQAKKSEAVAWYDAFPPEQLVLQYAGLYQSGDLMGMMSLFTPDATINGKQGIKYVAQTYDRLFRDTRMRKYALTSIRKSGSSVPHSVQMQLRAKVTQQLAAGGDPLVFNEMIDMEIVLRNDRLYILRLTQHTFSE